VATHFVFNVFVLHRVMGSSGDTLIE